MQGSERRQAVQARGPKSRRRGWQAERAFALRKLYRLQTCQLDMALPCAKIAQPVKRRTARAPGAVLLLHLVEGQLVEEPHTANGGKIARIAGFIAGY